VVIGGGIVGVELVADIIFRYPSKKVRLVSKSPSLLPELPEKCGLYSYTWLTKRHVKVDLGTVLTPTEAEEISQKPDTVLFTCVGCRPTSNLFGSFIQSGNGGPKPLRVDQKLRVIDKESRAPVPNVFAIGDIASHPSEAE